MLNCTRLVLSFCEFVEPSTDVKERKEQEDMMAPAMPTRRSISWLAVLVLCVAQALTAQCSNNGCLSGMFAL